MAQETFTEPADDTHQYYFEDNLSTGASHGSMSSDGDSDRDQSDEENSELDYLAFNMPPAPPPTRENSLVNRGTGARGAAGLIQPHLLDLSAHNFTQQLSDTDAGPSSPSSSASFTPDSESDLGSQGEGEVQTPEGEQEQFNWGDGEADGEIEDLWNSVFPEGGGWKIDVQEHVNLDHDLGGQMFLSVAVNLTENNPSN